MTIVMSTLETFTDAPFIQCHTSNMYAARTISGTVLQNQQHHSKFRQLDLTSLTMCSNSSKIDNVCRSPACSAILYRFTVNRRSTVNTDSNLIMSSCPDNKITASVLTRLSSVTELQGLTQRRTLLHSKTVVQCRASTVQCALQ